MKENVFKVFSMIMTIIILLLHTKNNEEGQQKKYCSDCNCYCMKKTDLKKHINTRHIEYQCK